MAGVQKVTVPEIAIHAACVEILSIYEARGKLTYLHPANGIFLRGTDKQRAAEIAKMKRMGFRPGAPDLIIIFAGGRTAWIELKSATGTLEPSQKEWRDRLQSLGHEWHLFRDSLELRDWLKTVAA